MVPTAEARMTRQMLYSAISPATTFVRLAILPPVDATWVPGGAGNKFTPARSCGTLALPFATPSGDLAMMKASPGFSDGRRESHRSYMGWVKLSRMYFVPIFRGAVRGLAAFVLKLTRDVGAGNFSFFCGRCGRRDQRRCGRGQLRGVSGAAIYGCAAGSSERDEHSGAMGGDHGEWRRLPHETGYSRTGNDSTHCYQRDRRRRGRYFTHQNASA